jgi:intracellular sulfur oxidation DsrE/DsrF family protein
MLSADGDAAAERHAAYRFPERISICAEASLRARQAVAASPCAGPVLRRGADMHVSRTLCGLALALLTATAWAQDRVVYHVDHAASQGLKGLRNIRNHLDVDPGAKITVVTHAEGVDFLMEGAKDGNGGVFAGPVAALVARGVKFEVCEITLRNRNLKKEQFIQEAEFTPSGVVRIAKMQKDGAAYIKP